jgi:hypothetical protein
MWRILSGIGVVGLALAGGASPQGRNVYSAGPAAASPQATVTRPQRGTPERLDAPQRALLNRYCVTCHNDKLKTAGLVLENVDISDVSANAGLLEKVVRKLRSGQMPPPGRPRPDQVTIDAFATALATALDRAAAAAPNPGRIVIHRLNRTEYVNVIQDLLKLDIEGSEFLPGDMAGFGFDNNADVLSITPALMARYMSAATKISRLAVGSPDNRSVRQVYAVGFARQDARMNEDMPFATHGGLAARYTFPLDGEYGFRVVMKRQLTGSWAVIGMENEHEIELRIDHALVKRFTVGGKFRGPDRGAAVSIPESDVEGRQLHYYRMHADKDLQIRVPVTAGTRVVTLGFVDHTVSPHEGTPQRPVSLKLGRGGGGSGDEPGIDELHISGPFDATVPQETPSRRRIFTCRPTSAPEEGPCSRQIITTLARRAFRGPVTEGDIKPLLDIYQKGRSERDFDAGIERALEALLVSPKFLLRVEPAPADVKPGALVRLSDLELASRLSFFLWRSIPDDQLLAIASRGELTYPAVLARQVQRMLADPRAARFMDDFVGQWLQVRNLSSKDPDPNLFPDFDDTLRDAMVRETELFFQSQVREDHPVLDLLRADYTYLNERLARHYGVHGVYGSSFRRVSSTDERRLGLLGQASVLMVSSYAHRTSVVLRGKWILENVLGMPPPPPPPSVPPLKENDGTSQPTSLRERMEAHRSNPVCASCHAPMDPYGFVLENFDATGRWRENDEGIRIDASGTLADGMKIEGPQALRNTLLNRRDQFARTVIEKLLTYALGRGVEHFDGPAVRQIIREAAPDDYRWSGIVLAIVKSTPFQMRRVADANTVPPVVTTVAEGR